METVTYPLEQFTEEEQARLAPHFTNLDRPVFALVNLPETVKGALFARYSRYAGTLRRLFLDEFADSLPEVPVVELGEGERAAKLYETIFLGYGDDSVAQLGGAHIACEWTSNLLTKILQRPRLAAYLEQSTRYIAYDAQLDGFGYRYHRDPRFGPAYEAAMDELFATYSALARGRLGLGGREVPGGGGRVAGRAPARRAGQGARPRPRRPPGGVALARRDLRHRPDVRAARPPPARASARRGARVRRDAARGAAGGDAELRHARAAPGSRRPLDRVPARAERGGRRRARRGSGSTKPRRRGRCSVGAPAPGARQRGGAARRAALRGLDRRRGAGARGSRRLVGRGARRARPRPRRRAREPPPPPGPRLRDAHLPLRDRLRLRRLPRPAAPPPAHVPVAAAVAGSRRRRPARGRGGRPRPASTRARSRPHAPSTSGCAARGSPTRRRTRSASPIGSATCSSSTRARRST